MMMKSAMMATTILMMVVHKAVLLKVAGNVLL